MKNIKTISAKNKIQTVVILKKGNEVLLGFKKRGFGAGLWNGFGGKVEINEPASSCAKRELFEESGITAKKLLEMGIINFEFTGKSGSIEVHFFLCDSWQGEPTESEEMIPKWFGSNEIPYGEMWPDDRYWMPLLLDGRKFSGRFVFENNKILSKSLLTRD